MNLSTAVDHVGPSNRRQSRTSIASARSLPVFMQIAEHNDVDLLRDLFIEFKQHMKRRHLVTFDKRMMQWVSWAACVLLFYLFDITYIFATALYKNQLLGERR